MSDVKKRVLSLGLAAALMLGMAFGIGLGPLEASAAGFAVSDLTPDPSGNLTVHYGYYAPTTQWRIVADNGDTFTMLSHGLTGDSQYSLSGKNHHMLWSGSDIKINLENNYLPGTFGPREIAAMQKNYADTENTYYNASISLKQTIVLPSYAEVTGGWNLPSLNEGRHWWLRSPGYDNNQAAYVDATGVAHPGGPLDTDAYVGNVYGLRPVFKLKKESIFLATPASYDKQTAVGALEALAPLSGGVKLTLKDSSINVNISSENVTARGNVYFNYSGLAANHRLSAVVKSGGGNGPITHYGQVQVMSAGSGYLELPGDFDRSSDKLYVFAEELNGANRTDFAGPLHEIPVPYTPPTAGSLSVSDVNFATVNVGYTPADLAKTITIVNNGETTATVNSVELTGQNTNRFAITQVDPDNTVPRFNTSWKILPAAGLEPGVYSSTITVNYDGTQQASAPVTIEIHGSGSGTDANLRVTEVDFGAVAPDSTVPPSSIILTNIGGAIATVNSIQTAGADADAFIVAGSTSVVAAGNGTDSSWTIAPAANLEPGSYTADIVVTYNGSKTATGTVRLTVMDRDKAALDVGDVDLGTVSAGYSSFSVPIVIDNNGDGSAENVRVTLSTGEAYGSEFTVVDGLNSIPGNTQDNSWEIHVNDGLPVSDDRYEIGITVTYDGGPGGTDDVVRATARLTVRDGAPSPDADLVVGDVDLGTVSAGYSSLTVPIVINNRGDSDAENVRVTLSTGEAYGSEFTVVDGAASIPANTPDSSWEIRVNDGLPVSDDPYEVGITVTYDGGPGGTDDVVRATARLTVRDSAPAPDDADLVVSDVNFGTLSTGYSPQFDDLIIENRGGADATITDLWISSADLDEFRIDNTYIGTVIEAGDRATLTQAVELQDGLPEGRYEVGIVVEYSGGANDPAEYTATARVTVGGSTAPGDARLAVDDVVYTAVTGNTEQTRDIVIRNSGDGDARIDDIVFENNGWNEGDFTILSGGDAVPAGGSNSSWKIRSRSGMDRGIYNAEFTVTFLDGHDPLTARVQLTVGDDDSPATEARLQVDDVTIPDAAPGYTPRARGITIRNTGGGEAAITDISLTDWSRDAFEIVEGDSTVAADGRNTSWQVRPVQGLPEGTYNAKFTVTYDGGASGSGDTAEAVVRFNVRAGAGSDHALLRADNIDFGSIPADYSPGAVEQTIAIDNSGDADATNVRVTISGADSDSFALESGNARIAAGEQDTSWKIRPVAGLAPGEYSAAYTVAYEGGDNDPDSIVVKTIRLTVAGGAATPSLTVSPGSLAFGSIQVGATARDSVTVTGHNLTGSIDFTLVDTTGAFRIDGAQQVDVGGTVRIAFAPAGAQSYSAYLLFESEGAQEVRVPITGTGVSVGGAELSTVNFYTENDFLYATRQVERGSTLGGQWPGNPSRSGYSFSGWYTGKNAGGSRYTSSTAINGDIDLYAAWTQDGGNGNGNGNGGGSSGGGSGSGSGGSVRGGGSSGGGSYRNSIAGDDRRTLDSSSSQVTPEGDYKWRVDLPFLGFFGAYVDGDLLTRGTDYTAREGSTIVALTDSYIRSLSRGSHRLRLEFVAADVYVDFDVTAPSTNRSGGAATAGNAATNRSQSGGTTYSEDSYSGAGAGADYYDDSYYEDSYSGGTRSANAYASGGTAAGSQSSNNPAQPSTGMVPAVWDLLNFSPNLSGIQLLLIAVGAFLLAMMAWALIPRRSDRLACAAAGEIPGNEPVHHAYRTSAETRADGTAQ